ncbi:cbb3-type cytochrome oxidase assembly protein CcoS [Telmatocola sphagniphila]|jgi:cbb3-type cytochrome oxidase maturation protein|uniref:Cbb3-type cytochrome oxidase assembly protein CcoS n=1 Tax=Telmatocola sphagniphila TaxID=1123043 RepID=A0A8E6B8E4_9BACT|nr:cbb3-type cytochrome oxidase assembly protein CcoS [Telmatocola sphagniphila]QVL33257.1 cbb3-type cytochrome oxidase assembly protein CcoS [Telmatocola sphagniphila]
MSIPIDPEVITSNDKLMILIVTVASLMFSAAMIMALAWGVKDGQFENFTRSARAIFDPDEPIGETTDAFPGQPQRRPSQPGRPTAD